MAKAVQIHAKIGQHSVKALLLQLLLNAILTKIGLSGLSLARNPSVRARLFFKW